MIFRTELVNFRTVLYEGSSIEMALKEAMRSGFEAMVTNVTIGVSCLYSPVTGWKGKLLPTSSCSSPHAIGDTC
jgi:hypothetical protein